MGTGEETEEEASEALVIMVVGLKKAWKAPVAYYLTTGVQAELQAQLLLQTTGALREAGLRPYSLTLDGHQTNQSMVRILGARMNPGDDFRPSFSIPEYPVEDIFVVYDACHMLKLVKNSLHDLQIIMAGGMDQVRWDHIVQLHKIQDAVGLRLGNRLTKRHVLYANHKMKVSIVENRI